MKKNSLKICLLNDTISPSKTPLFEELSKKYNLRVLFCNSKMKDRLWKVKLENYSFKKKILPNLNFNFFFLNYTLFIYLLLNKFDVYILGERPEFFISEFVFTFFAKIRRKPLIIWSGAINKEILTINREKNFFNRLIYLASYYFIDFYKRILFKLADSFVVYGVAAKRFIQNYQIKEEIIFAGTQIMPEKSLFGPSIKINTKKSKNQKIILSLGYLRKDKGLQYLINAFNKLNKKNVFLWIVGDGDYKKELKKIVRGNKNIKFFAYAEGIKKANFYSLADFFVFPTLNDCWGLVINESLYYGVPVISTNKAGASELIENGKTGIIISDRDVPALVKSMKKLLDSPKILTKMKKNIKKIPKSKIVDINTSVKTFKKAINYAIKKHGNNKK